MCLASYPGDLLATYLSREKRVFCVSRLVFKTFQFSLEHFVTIHYLPHLNLSQTHHVTLEKSPLLLIISTPIFMKKV